MVAARLRGARELREGDERDVEFLRQAFQLARNLRDLLLARLDAARGAGHQLQVVNDDQVEALLLRGEPPGLRAHLQHRDARRVVYENLRVGERAQGAGEPRPLVARQIPAAEAVRVHPPLRAEHPHHQRLLRHLQREDGDDRPRLNRRVLRERQAEARVVNADVVGDEVVRLRNGQVVDLLIPCRLD